ncbi:MAG: 1-acyl-sn-glycerol-3-phosphate acyltransferase [Clostridia bacterium]|nr:1-acyl-sn-glycerol-3-phosphate acyltransferase [Clostridia bacterium]
MKIKSVAASYDYVMSLKPPKAFKAKRPNLFFTLLKKTVSLFMTVPSNFKVQEFNMDKLDPKEPCFVLMNHSSFVDLAIAESILFPRRYNIIVTSDGFVGKNWLMRQIGCIPTHKYVTDPKLISQIRGVFNKLNSSLLVYPEASYSFDGTCTTLPESLGAMVKMARKPLVIVTTHGAFARDPLYNNIQVRKVDINAEVTYALTPEQLKEMSTQEINEVIQKYFSFDNWKWQQENKVKIDVPWRADYLNRVLYKCPNCGHEACMEGKGIKVTCHDCGKTWTLDEYGYLKADDGVHIFNHVPDWYKWERDMVRREILDGKYQLDLDVDIAMMVDTKTLYRVGSGRLVHNRDGFELTGCDGKLHYTQKPLASYCLYSDFNWYEIGDVISIGDDKVLYYCFPKNCGDVVAKARLAAEEMYKIVKAETRK